MSPRSVREPAWLLVADERGGRLLRGQPAAKGRVRLVEEGRVAPAFVASEHGRPSPLGAKDGHAWTAPGHEDEERLAQLAREVTAFAMAQMEARALPRLRLLAPARLVGALRKTVPARLLQRITLQVLDLGHLPRERLEQHPEVLAACAS